MIYIKDFFRYTILSVWAVLCLLPAVIIFYVMECIELAKIISSFIEKSLRE